jgi:alcohol dehydrogenase
LLTAQVLRAVARDVIVFGRHEHKLAIARSLGLEAEPASGALPVGAVDIVVDATGRPEGFRTALELVRPRGTIVMKSTFHGEAPMAPWPIVVNEVTIVGSRCGPFPDAIAVLASGTVRTGPLVSRIARLEEYESAFADARRSMKVVFRISP